MTTSELTDKLRALLALPTESEAVEFKEARNNFHFDELGKYFSALSNEANLKRLSCGWLVFGVQDRPRQIVGTQYRAQPADLEHLKQEIAMQTSQRLTFEHVHELITPAGRVLLFQIPAALRGVPTAWKGHFYGRDGESLGPLNLHELEQIRAQAVYEDWSAKIAEGATLADLDPQAIQLARAQYLERYPQLAADLSQWDDLTFLNKAKVCRNGQVTNAALLLLGKDDASHLLLPAHARITWILRDERSLEKDYEHFGLPFILTSEQARAKIRNLTVRHLPNDTLFPLEFKQYDSWVIRELLHNCVAHQDYPRGGRINLVESPETLVFSNLGSFLPGTVEAVIRRNAPSELYRNLWLTQAMINLNMIETIGSGIRKMFLMQRQRNFPLPDYDLSEAQRVLVKLTGRILDENYTNLLLSHTELDLFDVIALDKVQKKRKLSDDEFNRLKRQKLIEGRRPNVFVSARIAAVTDTKAAYIKNRGLDKQHYQALVISFLTQFGPSKREDLDAFLREKISDALTPTQKTNRIRNLLQEMRRNGTLSCQGHGPVAIWGLAKQQTN